MKAEAARRPRDPESTREAILEAAFEEIYLHGFQAASLSRIVQRAGVTKGALYHHFANKQELGYAVFDEMIQRWFEETWFQPLRDCDDPIDCLLEIIQGLVEELTDDRVALGCPLNNLSQEMSPVDEKFRARTDRLNEHMRHAMADALRRGQRHGRVREDVDADAVAALILATRQGTISLCKSAHSAEVLRQSVKAFVPYLESLRTPA